MNRKFDDKGARRISRRQMFVHGLAWAGVSVEMFGSSSRAARRAQHESSTEKDKEGAKRDKAAREGRLLARPKKLVEGAAAAATTGLQHLGLEGASRDILVYVPAQYRAEHPAPLAVMLHGAGGSDARQGLSLLQSFADEAGIILLAPSSQERTWDVILHDAYGADVSVIDRALEQTFARYSIDRKHIAIGGFSDGASYALSLGLINADLFTHVMAFSPGLVAASQRAYAPRFFISHGKQDRIIPIETGGRKIAADFTGTGYDVRLREFDGPHALPPEVAREAVEWFTGKRLKQHQSDAK